jgi:hypothetical protein
MANLLDELRANARRFDAAIGHGLVADYDGASEYLEQLLAELPADMRERLATEPAERRCWRWCPPTRAVRRMRRALAGLVGRPWPQCERSLPAVPRRVAVRLKRRKRRARRRACGRQGADPPDFESERRPTASRAAHFDDKFLGDIRKNAGSPIIEGRRPSRNAAKSAGWLPQGSQFSAGWRQQPENTSEFFSDPRSCRPGGRRLAPLWPSAGSQR